MTWIIDGFLVFVFALCLALGWRRGFIRTVRGFIALVLAVVLAGLISAPIADVLYDKTVKPAVSDVLETHIEGTLLPTEEELDQALENMPDLVTTLLQAGGLNNAASVLDKVDSLDAAETAAQAIEERVIAPIVRPLIRILCAVVLFILVYALASILLSVLDVVAKLPLLNQLNNGLGFVTGALSGVLWVMFTVSVLYALAQLAVVDWLTPALLEETKIASWMSGFLAAAGA
jgi:uncharacterized membrane protein required for colicin V production